MGTRNRRTSFAAATAVVLFILALNVQVAVASRLLSVTHVGANPGIIDLMIKSVGFDAASGVVTVTGSVTCAAPLDLLFVDFTAVQSKPTVITGFSTVAPDCASPFSDVIESDGPFKKGRLVIEASAFACAVEGGCAAEVVRIEAVLVAPLLLRQPACPDLSPTTRHPALKAFLAPGCRGPSAGHLASLNRSGVLGR